MLGVTSKDARLNMWIKQTIKVTVVNVKAAKLKWIYADHVTRRHPRRWDQKAEGYTTYVMLGCFETNNQPDMDANSK